MALKLSNHPYSIKVSILKLIPHIRLYDGFMLSVVLINTLALAFFDYRGGSELEPINKIVDDLNSVITCIFIVEGVILLLVRRPSTEYRFLSMVQNGWLLINLAIIVTG